MTDEQIITAYQLENKRQSELVILSGRTATQIKTLLNKNPKWRRKDRLKKPKEVPEYLENQFSNVSKEKKQKIITLWVWGYKLSEITEDQRVSKKCIMDILKNTPNLKKIIRKNIV